MSVRAMFYVKEINHRATSQPGEVNVELKPGAAFGGYLRVSPWGPRTGLSRRHTANSP